LTGAEAGSEEELQMQLDRAAHLAEAGAGEEALAPLLALLPRIERAPASPATATIFRELGERSWVFANRRERARGWVQRAHAQFVELAMTESASEAKAWLNGHPL
jgi:hypothetical protein